MSQHSPAIRSITSASISEAQPATPRRASVTRWGAALTAVAALALAGLAMGPASPALAHDELVSSEVVTAPDGAVEAIQLSFSNSIIELGTEFVITDATGTDATAGAPEVSGPNVTQPLAADLEAGDYAGAWRVVSSDGHPIDGAFTLSVAADGSAELLDPAAAGDHDAEQATPVNPNLPAAGTDLPPAPTSLYVFLGIGGVLVIAVVIAAFVARSRRLAQMQRDADQTDGKNN
ncbi:methionine-rich copper-binding protein CopC [Leucobacter exalbidus]|uniref:Methionine-rich copper-binding protein CopC n=1 Tax=Leucobacter exalbidus TaxID=662960 RepID=A0A940PVG6_9MICO|nr:copper resistance protein CopC [Leucobacter exalbidus]MBP1327583.1 methionine-rich copper-binding protein CopC [Leucobacter exalbidus]